MNHFHRRVPLATGVALVAFGLVTACSGAEAPAAPPGPAPTTATTAAATSAAAAPATRHAAAGTATPAPEGAIPGVEPVSCGPVGPEGGDQVDLIADSTPAGRVGCTEAINVIYDYYEQAPTKAEGTGLHLVVDGWACSADTGAGTDSRGSIGCEKDGLAFHTEP